MTNTSTLIVSEGSSYHQSTCRKPTNFVRAQHLCQKRASIHFARRELSLPHVGSQPSSSHMQVPPKSHLRLRAITCNHPKPSTTTQYPNHNPSLSITPPKATHHLPGRAHNAHNASLNPLRPVHKHHGHSNSSINPTPLPRNAPLRLEAQHGSRSPTILRAAVLVFYEPQ